MDHYFEYLKTLTLDPFSQRLAARGAEPAAMGRGREHGTVDPRAEQAIANGPWWQCEGCCDPGPDEFPEGDEVRSASCH